MHDSHEHTKIVPSRADRLHIGDKFYLVDENFIYANGWVRQGRLDISFKPKEVVSILETSKFIVLSNSAKYGMRCLALRPDTSEIFIDTLFIDPNTSIFIETAKPLDRIRTLINVESYLITKLKDDMITDRTAVTITMAFDLVETTISILLDPGGDSDAYLEELFTDLGSQMRKFSKEIEPEPPMLPPPEIPKPFDDRDVED